MASQAEIIRTLYEMADYRLLGEGSWPADRYFVSMFTDLVRRWGLEEVSPRDPCTSYFTRLGRLVNLDKMAVFIGVHEPFDIPYLLEVWGYIDTETFDEIFASIDENNVEEIVREYVRKAYLSYCKRTSRPN
jgi:hypothetical protein